MRAKVICMLNSGYQMIHNNYEFLVEPFPQLRLIVPTPLKGEPIIIIIHAIHIMQRSKYVPDLEPLFKEAPVRKIFGQVECHAFVHSQTLISTWQLQARYLLEYGWEFESQETLEAYEAYEASHIQL